MGIKVAGVNMCVGWGELVLLLESLVEIFGACPVRAGIYSGNVYRVQEAFGLDCPRGALVHRLVRCVI